MVMLSKDDATHWEKVKFEYNIGIYINAIMHSKRAFPMHSMGTLYFSLLTYADANRNSKLIQDYKCQNRCS